MNSRYSRIHLLYRHPTQEQTAAYFFLSLTIYHSNSQSGWDGGGLAVLNESRVRVLSHISYHPPPPTVHAVEKKMHPFTPLVSTFYPAHVQSSIKT